VLTERPTRKVKLTKKRKPREYTPEERAARSERMRQLNAAGGMSRKKGSKYPHGATNAVIPRTPENAAKICDMIIQGMSLTAIGHAMGANSHTTILMWVAQDAEFEAQYRRAKEAQADAFGEQIIGIADDVSADHVTRVGRDGKEYRAVDNEAVLRSRLRVDARFRMMAHMAPRRYGPKVDHQHSGEVIVRTTMYGDAPAPAPARYIDVTPTTEEGE
jgi:hypothetical protein